MSYLHYSLTLEKVAQKASVSAVYEFYFHSQYKQNPVVQLQLRSRSIVSLAKQVEANLKFFENELKKYRPQLRIAMAELPIHTMLYIASVCESIISDQEKPYLLRLPQ